MTHEGNLRYYGLGSLTALTIVGWILEKVPPEITVAVFGAVSLIVTADVYKHRNDK